jgi:hypothetical protein
MYPSILKKKKKKKKEKNPLPIFEFSEEKSIRLERRSSFLVLSVPIEE